MFDDSFNVIDCNETILAICGVTRQYYMEHHYDLSPEYQPDGMKTTEKLPEALKRVLSGERLVMEWLYLSTSGEPIPCEITLTRIKYGGKYISMAYVYDLSHIKKMEESIQLLKTEAEKIYFDALTGIHNRRYFDENQDRIIKTLSRSGGKLSLMMIDIDFFKNYNDTYGHKEGDNCLRMVADTLEKCVTRTDDFIARYGGEEFVVVLPNTDQKGACVIAKKLLKNMRELKIPHAKSAAADYVTVSIGVTTGAVSHTQDMDDYVRRADEMLYKSKQNGRNKYSFKRL
jgi:diguanylate cyclase (GGDEF)-like protein